MGRTSTVWQHFDVVDGKKSVRCKVCSATFKYMSSTSSLQYHLRNSPGCNSRPSSQANANDVSGGRKPSPARDQLKLSSKGMDSVKLPQPRQDQLADKVVTACITVGLSFRQMGRMEGLFKALNPRFAPPSRKTIRTLLEKKYNSAVSELSIALRRADAVAFTTDSATTVSQTSLQAVTAHFLTRSWSPVSVVVALFELTGSLVDVTVPTTES